MGSNRVALGAKQATQQQAMALEESGEMEEMEETSELVRGEIEVGVRVGIGEEESDVEEIPSQQSQQS